MPPPPSPADILAAIFSIEREWPDLIGAEWPNIEKRYQTLRARLENATGSAQMLAAAELVELFASYAAAQERLNEAITANTKVDAILLNLADLANQLGLDPSVAKQFRDAARPDSSIRYIWQTSPTKATSLKLGNLSFEFGAFSDLVTGAIITASKNVLGEADVILKAAGVLLLIRSFYGATAIQLDEREATVFCGFARRAVMQKRKQS